jgi:SAM-dependent methyltransferase
VSALAEAYSATGAAWDRPRIYHRLATAVVARSPVPLVGARVLDLGAGTGAVSRAVLAAGGRPVAVDLAAGMLRAGPPGVSAAVGDAVALPFRSAAFDAVVAGFSLNHVADASAALREARRVCRPGGGVVSATYAADDDSPVKAAVDQAATAFGWVPRAWLTEMRKVAALVADPADVRRCADAAGLTAARVHRVVAPFPELSPADLVEWRLGMAHLAPFVAGLPPRERAALRAHAVRLVAAAPLLERRILVLAARA